MAVYMHRFNGTLISSVVIAFSAFTAVTPCSADPNAMAGKAFAQANCSHCHSIDKVTQSTLAIAPPFRTLHERYPVELLEEVACRGDYDGSSETCPSSNWTPGKSGTSSAFLKTLEQRSMRRRSQGV